ncbi:hypothetical protein HT136_04515 [Novosphingobium profundi]|uniref:hypothetical protein n=1 Tax=Novosphingobium profundi TaxID=1774954 RepID=UPI001BD9AD21|nr:hypothetical protein [Novosphingobium profundi]
MFSILTNLLHLGLVCVGLPPSFKRMASVDEMAGGSPYGPTTIAGSDGERAPGKLDLEGAHFHGAHVATIAGKLCGA